MLQAVPDLADGFALDFLGCGCREVALRVAAAVALSAKTNMVASNDSSEVSKTLACLPKGSGDNDDDAREAMQCLAPLQYDPMVS